MLNQQPIKSHPLIRQVSKAHSQSSHQFAILTILGVAKPLLQSKGLLDSFIKLPPKPLALRQVSREAPVYTLFRVCRPREGGIEYFSGAAHHLISPVAAALPTLPNGSRRALGGNWGRYLNA